MHPHRYLPITASSATAPDTGTVARAGHRATSAMLWLALFASLAMPGARATDVSVEIGPSWSGKSALGSTPAGFVQVTSDGAFTVLDDRFQVNPVAIAGVVAGRGNGANRHDVWLAGAGVRISRAAHGTHHWVWETHVFVSPNGTPSLCGHLQFGNSFGYVYGPWEVKARHLSNAGRHAPNHGETMLLVGYRF